MFNNISVVYLKDRICRHPLAISKNHVPFVGEINGWQSDLFSFYIIPNIKFSPIGDWENTYIFSFLDLSIKDIPKFWSLSFWVPLPKIIPYRKNPFFGSGLFLIATSSANTSIKAVLFDSVE